MAYAEYRVTKHGENAKVLRKRAGAYIKRLREDQQMTQADLARKLGFEYYTFISQIETGLTRVPPEKLPEFAKALGVPADEFTKNLMEYYDPFTFKALFGKKGNG